MWRAIYRAGTRFILGLFSASEDLCHDVRSSAIFELLVRASHPFSISICRERSPSRMFNLDTALRSGCVPATSGFDPATSGYDPATITAQRPWQLYLEMPLLAGPALR